MNRAHIPNLPFPMSVNRMYRSVNNRMLLSKDGRVFKANMTQAMLDNVTGAIEFGRRLRVHLLVRPPDRRKRDLDNLLKPMLDCLQAADIIEDDAHIDLLTIERHSAVKGGWASVTINQIQGGD